MPHNTCMFEKFPFPWLNKSGKRDASEERDDDELR